MRVPRYPAPAPVVLLLAVFMTRQTRSVRQGLCRKLLCSRKLICGPAQLADVLNKAQTGNTFGRRKGEGGGVSAEQGGPNYYARQLESVLSFSHQPFFSKNQRLSSTLHSQTLISEYIAYELIGAIK